jgi:hypothetical protein
MPDLTPAEQPEDGLLRLVRGRGPVEVEEARRWLVREALGHRVDLRERSPREAVEFVVSRGLLLGRGRTVECRRCGGSGDHPDPGPSGERVACPCQITGSVKEWVIGRPCSECGGETMIPAPRGAVAGARGMATVPCPACASTPTPGLDPGSESEAR